LVAERGAAPARPASSAGLPGGLGRRVRRPTPEARSRGPKSRGEAPQGAPARV